MAHRKAPFSPRNGAFCARSSRPAPGSRAARVGADSCLLALLMAPDLLLEHCKARMNIGQLRCRVPSANVQVCQIPVELVLGVIRDWRGHLHGGHP